MTKPVKKKSGNLRQFALIIGPLISLAIVLFADLDPDNKKVTYTFAIALLMAIWWITEAIPLAANALFSAPGVSG